MRLHLHRWDGGRWAEGTPGYHLLVQTCQRCGTERVVTTDERDPASPPPTRQLGTP